MTVVAWNGTMMAADRLICANGVKRETTKIYEFNNKIIGFAGTLSKCFAVLEWVKNGMEFEKYPNMDNEEEGVDFLLYDKENKTLMYYENGPYPIPLSTSSPIAIGSGTHFAEAAMKIGKSAKCAVEITNELSLYCGMGVDVIYVDAKG